MNITGEKLSVTDRIKYVTNCKFPARAQSTGGH